MSEPAEPGLATPPRREEAEEEHRHEECPWHGGANRRIVKATNGQMKRKGAPMSRTTSAAGFIVIEGLFVGGLVGGGFVGGFGGGGFEGVFGGGGDIGGGEDDHGGAQAAEL